MIPYPKPQPGEKRADFIERERAFNKARAEERARLHPPKRRRRAAAVGVLKSEPDVDGRDRDNLGLSSDW